MSSDLMFLKQCRALCLKAAFVTLKPEELPSVVFANVCSYGQECALHLATKVAPQESVWLIKALNVGTSVSGLNFAI